MLGLGLGLTLGLGDGLGVGVGLVLAVGEGVGAGAPEFEEEPDGWSGLKQPLSATTRITEKSEVLQFGDKQNFMMRPFPHL